MPASQVRRRTCLGFVLLTIGAMRVFDRLFCQAARDAECIGGAGGLDGGLTHVAASKTCESMGMRLCTATELNGGGARNSGCGRDNKFIWSGTECDNGGGKPVDILRRNTFFSDRTRGPLQCTQLRPPACRMLIFC